MQTLHKHTLMLTHLTVMLISDSCVQFKLINLTTTNMHNAQTCHVTGCLKKVSPVMYFGKCGPIFTILSTGDS